MSSIEKLKIFGWFGVTFLELSSLIGILAALWMVIIPVAVKVFFGDKLAIKAGVALLVVGVISILFARSIDHAFSFALVCIFSGINTFMLAKAGEIPALSNWFDQTHIVQPHAVVESPEKPKSDLKLEQTLLGKSVDSQRPFAISDQSLNTHMLVAGTTGGGKTVTVSNIVQSFIERGLPVIYIDGKGDMELAEKVIQFARSQDRPANFFSMIGESCAYNPLSSGGFSSKKDRIIELREWSEDHYRKLAEGYLQTVFKVLEKCHVETDLLTLADHMDRVELIKLIRANQADLGTETAQKLMNEIEAQEDAEKSISSLKAEIINLSRSELAERFGTGEEVLNLANTIETGGVAYIALSPLTFPAPSDTLGKLIINDLKASLNPTKPKKVLLVVDEFTTLAGMQVLNLLNQGRSMGLHAVITIQSLADLGQKIDRNPQLFIEQVLANCNVYCVHRMNNATDAETLAASIGTKQKFDITSQIDGAGATGMGSVRKTREFFAHPDQIKALKTGEAYFIDKPQGKFTKLKVSVPELFSGEKK